MEVGLVWKFWQRFWQLKILAALPLAQERGVGDVAVKIIGVGGWC